MVEKTVDGIADYTFIRSLGPGHFGGCFLARPPERLPVDVEYVVIKIIEGAGTDAFRRAVTALRAVAAVPSPYLAALYDAGRQAGTFYHSTEYLPGGSLREPATPIDTTDAMAALAQVALAAQALHDRGIVHRDIRPGNVMLAEGRAKLTDPGLSHILTPGVAVPSSGGDQALAFCDPAMLDGRPVGPAVDVWSLGATLHWIASGRGLYGRLPADDPLGALRTVLHTPPAIDDGVDPAIAELVADCLRPWEERPTAAEVAERLQSLA